ncbi:unnamed protein product [Rodentolepis nana]|uniref:Phlebovirus glycoprotein G2 fusion domain-containing protein n=1 Tax=Rodentolepis nana TaxID=102285 RepID=A0A0R3TN92_RODNA|nr:unnamed protein product [Rodentolepis nana]
MLGGSITVPATNDTQCYCGYQKSSNTLMLRCASKKASLPSSKFTPVYCHRSGESVRIGDSKMLTTSDFPGMIIEPGGLSRLQDGGRVSFLQLNIPLQTRLLDALAFTGLPDLRNLHAWRSPIGLEACSLAVLPSLENIVIHCKSNFDRYLTFGSAFKSVRLTGCQGRNLQFICTRCSQQPEVSVLRIFPGPPLTIKNLGFISNLNNSLSLPSCRIGVCSEDHLCRNNMALKLALSNSIQSSTTTISPHTTTSRLAIITSAPQLQNGQIFLTIFLPIFLLILIISCFISIVLCLRISRAFKRKCVNQSPLDVRVTNSSSWSSSTPLNEPKDH